MSIFDLNKDVFSLIMKQHLSFEECELINDLFGLKLTNLDIFTNITDNIMCQNALAIHKINNKEFFDIIIYSAFEYKNIIKLIHHISNNMINNNNKYGFNIYFLLQFDDKTRYSSIMCVKIILTMINVYITGDFQINNPYNYLHTSISNILMNYLVNNIQTLYHIDNFAYNSLKFRVMVLENNWYKTTLNIYELFIIYLKYYNILQDIYDIDYHDIKFQVSDDVNQDTLECLDKFEMLFV